MAAGITRHTPASAVPSRLTPATGRRDRQPLVRVQTDSLEREPGCQPSEPGSTPPAAIWYRVRRFHPFPVRETLQGLCVPVGVVSTPGLFRKSLDFPVSQGVSSDVAPLFRSNWNRSAGGPIFRPFGRQSLSACRAQGPCAIFMGASVRKQAFGPSSLSELQGKAIAGRFAQASGNFFARSVGRPQRWPWMPTIGRTRAGGPGHAASRSTASRPSPLGNGRI